MSATLHLPDRITVHYVRTHWGLILEVLRPTDGDAAPATCLTIYHSGRPHVLALSPGLYDQYRSALGEPDTPPLVTIAPAEATPWRADLTDPDAPQRLAIASRGAQQSWAEIHTQVKRRRIHVTVLRNKLPAAVFVPLNWPPA